MTRSAVALSWAALIALVAGVAAAPSIRSSNRIELRGADAMLPIVRPTVEAYMTKHPDALVVVGQGNASRGLKALIVGVADIAMATDELPEQYERLAREREVKLKKNAVWRDAIVPVVAPQNPVDDLSLKQLRDIFRGAITNWKDVGGPDAPIEVVTHVGSSGTYGSFRRAVLGAYVVTPQAKTMVYDQYEAAIAGNPNAIGYIGSSSAGKLKVLSVGALNASAATIADGTYPILRTSCLWVVADGPTSALAGKLVDFFYTDEVIALIKARGSIPLARSP